MSCWGTTACSNGTSVRSCDTSASVFPSKYAATISADHAPVALGHDAPSTRARSCTSLHQRCTANLAAFLYTARSGGPTSRAARESSVTISGGVQRFLRRRRRTARSRSPAGVCCSSHSPRLRRSMRDQCSFSLSCTGTKIQLKSRSNRWRENQSLLARAAPQAPSAPVCVSFALRCVGAMKMLGPAEGASRSMRRRRREM